MPEFPGPAAISTAAGSTTNAHGLDGCQRRFAVSRGIKKRYNATGLLRGAEILEVQLRLVLADKTTLPSQHLGRRGFRQKRLYANRVG